MERCPRWHKGQRAHAKKLALLPRACLRPCSWCFVLHRINPEAELFFTCVTVKNTQILVFYGLCLLQTAMANAPVYFDYNASTPLKPTARQAMLAALDVVGNPTSVHGFGRTARKMLEDSREKVAAAIGVRPAQIVFTSGGTEANHLALCGTDRPLITSAVEHASVLAVQDTARIPVDSNGMIYLDALEDLLKKSPAPPLVSVMLANNETGVVQPIQKIAELVHAHGGLLHCDAAQGLGRIPVNFVLLGVDMLTLSAHKAGGPKGAGALVLGDRVGINPQLRGGGQEQRRRAGTENFVGIVGFGAALETLVDDMVTTSNWVHWRTDFEQNIALAAPAAIVYGQAAPRLPNTTYIGMPGVSAETQLMALDLAGFAISTGSACSSGKVKPSHVLQAMGEDDIAASQAIRISCGWETKAEDYKNLANAWLDLYRKKHAA